MFIVGKTKCAIECTIYILFVSFIDLTDKRRYIHTQKPVNAMKFYVFVWNGKSDTTDNYMMPVETDTWEKQMKKINKRENITVENKD